MWFHLASVLLFWVVVKEIGRVGIVRLSNRESVGAGAGHGAMRGAVLGPCHPNRAVVQYLSQMNRNWDIRL